MAGLGQQTVEFSTLVRRAAEDSFLSLKELVERSAGQSDSEKKISLLKYINRTRQRMLRLHVLAKWCQQIPLVQYCQQLASTLSSHDTCFTQAADYLFFTHEGLQQARAPIYDVPSAIEVLLTGTYQRLPKCIEDIGKQIVLPEEQKKPALLKLDTLLRSKLLELLLPKEISKVTVSNGTAQLCVDGEFRVMLTLGYRGYLSMWRILHLELLVGDKNGLVKFEESRRYAFGDELERRMAAAENPFMTLYSILHEFCITLVMDTNIRQLQILRQSRWKDAIRFDLISDGAGGLGGHVQLPQDAEPESATSGQRTPGLRIMYWLDPDRSSGGTDSSLSPFIKIEPGQDLQIRCSHSTFVIDPMTGNEAEFSLDQNCIDVEQLLLRAITCNRHTRLLEVHKELSNNSQICQTAGDVTLRCLSDESQADLSKGNYKFDVVDCGEEVLCVRAYGSSYITLGVNIRNGSYVLRSSKNIISSSALLECEEALNQGSMTASEVFMALRNKSILHLFASMGRFLGLKVYEWGFSVAKLAKIITSGSDLLLMGFPQCGSSYYLLMQLDKGFKPLFTLLESHEDSSGTSGVVGDIGSIKRFKKIDISKMHLADDEVTLNLLDWEKLNISPKDVAIRDSSEHGLSTDFSHEGSIQTIGCKQSTFASVVDEVFEIEKGASLPLSLPNKSQISSVTTPSSSPLCSSQFTYQGMKVGLTSSKSDGGVQVPQANFSKFSAGVLPMSNASYAPNSMKNMLHGSAINSFSSTGPVRSPPVPKPSLPKSDIDSLSFRSPTHAVDASLYSAMDEDPLKGLNEIPKELNALVSGGRASHLVPSARATSRGSTVTAKSSGPRSSVPTSSVGSPMRSSGSSSRMASPTCQTPESGTPHSPTSDATTRNEKNLRKRSISAILTSIPSLHDLTTLSGPHKRLKISESVSSLHAASPDTCSFLLSSKSESCSYGNLLAKANHGHAPSSVYFAVLLHVVRHCSLSIKHARLTSQMDALDISYVEEVGLRNPSCNLWFRLPLSGDNSWQRICLRLGRPGTMCWDVKVSDEHFRDLWELQKGNTSTPWGSGVRIANASDIDSHIRYDSEGVVLCYKVVEESSIQKLVEDLKRLSNARLFALGMRKVLGVRIEEKPDDAHGGSEDKGQTAGKGTVDVADKVSDQLKKSFRIEAVGLMSLWFSYFGSMPGIVVRFVVEWETGKKGCTMHVSPDQLWPHSKFLEDFINGGEVSSLLDCIRLTAGPLLALAGAIRPARMVGPGSPAVHATTVSMPTVPRQNAILSSQGLLPGGLSSNVNQPQGSAAANPVGGTSTMGSTGSHGPHNTAMLSAAGRGGPGIVPSSLLPTDVAVVLRGPYWIRILYRKIFAVDMRCFAGDQVWLQPATPPKGGPTAGGSFPCPQFRPFIMEHVAQGLNNFDTNFSGGAPNVIGSMNSSTTNPSLSSVASQPTATTGSRVNTVTSLGFPRSGTMIGNQGVSLNRIGNSLLGASNLGATNSGLPVRLPSGTTVPAQVRGELSSAAFIGLGDDGGYGGGWVPLAALKKVLRNILKYFGVLWLFTQLPDIIKEILGSILKDNEGTLLNLDLEQPALRFFVGGYVFAVSVHRMQLLLQVLSVKRFHNPQQQQQNHNVQEELTPSEIAEICDYFSRRVASEPYDASRVASFITLLTLPVSVLREFLKLISWKKGLLQGQFGDAAGMQKPQIELCLESHGGFSADEHTENSGRGVSKSNIHYDRAHSSVDFGLTLVLDPTHVPHINAAGGAAWLPYCVSIRLRYTFGETTQMSLLGMEGSHGGRACWTRLEDWERCKQRVTRAVEVYGSGNAGVDGNQGRLRIIAEFLLRALQNSLQQLRDGSAANVTSAAT
ncbi:mediator of RNA polymerase II transcription subunit 14 [Nymphaea colorata]|nr:mediator of RNA polymerase II transcription subunit 14 [Nymphaea colorata]